MTQDKVPRPPALLMTSPENLTQCSPPSEPNGLQSNSARFVRVIHTIHSHKAYLGKKLRTFAYLPSLRNKIRKETTIKHISKKKKRRKIAHRSKILYFFRASGNRLRFKIPHRPLLTISDILSLLIPYVHVEIYFLQTSISLLYINLTASVLMNINTYSFV